LINEISNFVIDEVKCEKITMIITKTPFRMSFFGGGTDIEDFFRAYGGAVLSTTFDKYCYVNVRHLPRFFDYSTELSYSIIERVTNIDDIKHPAVRNAMKMLDMHEIRLTYEADLPARSGLGTSSSFAVGMLNAFYALKGKYTSKKKLADDAIYLERVLCNEAGGWQDQIAASFGGFNRINFNKDGSYDVLPIIISPERKKQLDHNLLMFFTGFTRFSSEVQKANAANPETKEAKEEKLLQMLELVDEAQDVLVNKERDLDDFGRLLDYTWKLKKQTGSAVSTSNIDALYQRGMEAGALGGKLLGAGGGGFLVFYVQPEKREALKAAMHDLLYVPFHFEDGGTRVLYYSPEDYGMKDEA
jgi:D-glycero-alpha-D-manno-heptose-7-phosphate kinase